MDTDGSGYLDVHEVRFDRNQYLPCYSKCFSYIQIRKLVAMLYEDEMDDKVTRIIKKLDDDNSGSFFFPFKLKPKQ